MTDRNTPLRDRLDIPSRNITALTQHDTASPDSPRQTAPRLNRLTTTCPTEPYATQPNRDMTAVPKPRPALPDPALPRRTRPRHTATDPDLTALTQQKLTGLDLPDLC